MKNKLFRLFVAIDLPGTVKQELARVQQTIIKAKLFEGTYVDYENAHITLQFLGSVKYDHVKPIQEALRQVAVPPFTITLKALEVDNPKDSSGIWIALEGDGLLASLVHAINTALFPWVKPEARPFKGHITLARVKLIRDNKALMDHLDATEIQQIPFTVDSFTLKKSELTREGPIYSTIETYRLDN